MKRLGLVPPLLVALGCVLSSCATPTPTPFLPPPAPIAEEPTPLLVLQTPVTIVFWHSESADSPRSRLLTTFAQRFQQEYPWITVLPTYVGNAEEVGSKALVAVRSGRPPDLAAMPENWIATLMEAGALTPLDAYAHDPELGFTPEDRSDYYPGCWQSMRYPDYHNQILALPYSKTAVALYYNRTLLHACGIEQPPRTWAEFEQACLAVRKHDAQAYAYVESAATFQAWLLSRGGALLDPEQGAATFSDTTGLDSLELLLRLRDTNLAFRPEGDAGDIAAFATGQVAFTFGLTSAIPAYQAALAGKELDWGCTLIPQQEASPGGTLLVGPGLCVFHTDEARQQAAWRFGKWFNEPAQAAEWAAAGCSLPVRRAALARLAAEGWLEQNTPADEACETILPHAWPEPRLRSLPQVQRAVEDAWLAAIAGTQGSQEALDQAAGQVNELLATNR